MRIRRRARDAVQPSTTPSSPGFSLSAAAPVSSPRGSSPACSGAAAPADVKLPPASVEADGSTWEASPLRPHLPAHGQDRQGEENERGDDATERRKRGTGGGAEQAHDDVPAQVSSSTKANEEGQQSGEDEAEATVAICKKGDGKGWRCKREAQRGCSLCQYHLAKLRSYSRKKKRTTPPPETTHAAATTGDPLRRASRRRKTSDKELGESNGGGVLSGGFYYYSGFGPRWGKSRRDREDGDRLDDGGAGAVAEEEDYRRGDANGDGKTTKSRSLASLL